MEKMSLKNIVLKGVYNSDKDNLLEDFYIPVLSQSVIYNRIAGYFSSNSLAIAAKGITKLIENNGQMNLIVNEVLTDDDQKTILESLEEKQKIMLEEINTMTDLLKKDHLRLLSWMIKTNRLNIKIAIVRKGVEHKKKGILIDEKGNIVSFSGSDNETIYGWLHNDEDFHVFCSWIKGDVDRHLKPDIAIFKDLWEEDTFKVRVYDITSAFRLGLIKIAPKNEEEFETLSKDVAERLIEENRMRYKRIKSEIQKPNKENLTLFLREYQKKAIANWEKNGRNGIFDMATGTGKTFTAIACLNRYIEDSDKPFIVIVAPQQLLVQQWCDILKDFGFQNIILAMKDSSEWIPNLNGSLLKLKRKKIENLFVIATYKSFCTNQFTSIISDIKDDILLICDEMHHSWAESYRKGLLEQYNFKLGLSATPERYLDIDGTKEMQEYFGGIVFRFPIEKAIPEFLVEYEYLIDIVELSPEDKAKYKKTTDIIRKKIKNNNDEINENIMKLLERRANIVKTSDAKWAPFQRILDEIDDIKGTLIYCNYNQIDKVKKILYTRKIKAKSITYQNPLKHRQEIIDLFISDDYEAIVAMKVLDEGIDIPKIKRAIILASSGNPIEYIQRRGRILRKFEGKDFSIIHDILVFPWLDVMDDILPSEKRIIEKELSRVEEFVNSAKNPADATNKIAKYKSVL